MENIQKVKFDVVVLKLFKSRVGFGCMLRTAKRYALQTLDDDGRTRRAVGPDRRDGVLLAQPGYASSDLRAA